jgi:hypothetical protein
MSANGSSIRLYVLLHDASYAFGSIESIQNFETAYIKHAEPLQYLSVINVIINNIKKCFKP